MVGFTPNSRAAVYHIPDKRRRGAEAMCKHGIAMTAEKPPLNFKPCPVCYGRVSKR